MFADTHSDYLFTETLTPLLKLYEKFLPLTESANSIAIENTATPGFSPIYRNAARPHNPKKFLVKGIETCHSVFEDVAHQCSNEPCLKFRPQNYQLNQPQDYQTLTYNQVKQLKDHLGSGILYHLQVCPFLEVDKYESHSKIENHIKDYSTYDHINHSFIVTLYSNNRYEWTVTDLACSSYSISNTALYDTLGENTSEFILESTQSPIVICSKAHVSRIIKLKRLSPDKLGHIISIVSMDPLFESDYSLRKYAADNKIVLHDFKLIIALGEMNPVNVLPPSPQSLYTISFTSGTTGANPKGVSLSHRSATSSLTFYIALIPKTPDSFCFLPLAHIFERETTFATLGTGACVVYPQINYSALTLIEDLKFAKPTRISLVPRILNKFEASIKANTINSHKTSDLMKSVFNKVFNDKTEAHSQYDGAEGKNIIYDTFVTSKIKANFGFDNLKFMLVAAAPIDPQTVKFLKASMQIGLAQLYGTTEMFAAVCATPVFDAKPGSSGPPGINTEFKLKELPEMNYFLTDQGGPRGELLVRSHQNFFGYYKNPEETAKCLDNEGWYHTGDIAQITHDTGRICIIDRVKNFFKLAQGEFVTPETIENNYQSHNSLLTQMYAYGDPLKTNLVGILGIEKTAIINFLIKECRVKVDVKSLPEEELLLLINSLENKKVLVELLNKNVPHLKGFQKIKNAFVEFEPLTLDRNVVTPTMKLKRPVAKQFFAATLERLYKEGPIVASETCSKF